jgi:uncharacterized protein (DUF488 family)
MTCRTYSVGHSTHPLSEFAALCRGAAIDLVCDIRRFPVSRRHPQFRRDNMAARLKAEEIAYVWLGESLGGLRSGPYEDWMATPFFQRGLDELERLAQRHTVGFMCAEGVPDRCHRRFVGRALASRGHRVSHLLPDGRILPEAKQLELPDP